MLVVLSMLSWIIFSSCSCNTLSTFQHSEPQLNLEACVRYIMRKYFVDAQTLSYVNFGLEDDQLLEDIHTLEILSISIMRPTKHVMRYNRAYMIVARNEDEFLERIEYIKRESNWNPYVRYLIVLNTLSKIKLEKIFNSLLQLHIYNVVIVNGTETAELYTYNPFENYACGKYFLRIIEFGKCLHMESVDLYPNKVVTGLRNCFIQVSCAHWPPYSIEPGKSDDKPYRMGTEQYILHLMSEIEHFSYNFTFNYDPELFSLVSTNMSVSGPLTMLQANRTDVMLGGIMLTQSRARLFFHAYGHLDQVDEIRIIVKAASMTPAWKNFYLEFSFLGWSLILLALVLYSVLVMILLKAQDKGHVVMVLLDHLLLHGTKLHARLMVNIVIICWVWFAYLINCFYQSSLVSLTTKPYMEYQIDNEQSLNAYGLKACISQVMQKFLTGESLIESTFHNNTDTSCKGLMPSIKTVSESEYHFTITIYNIYLYNKEKLYDEYGNSPVYSFRKPFTKVIYAMYFYKGFPMGERLHELALRIREAGLSDKNLKDHYFLRKLKYRFHSRGRESRFAIPWYVFGIGVTISSLTLAIEIIIMKKILSSS